MVQHVYLHRPGRRSHIVETWVDLVSIDTGETVMTANIEGEYRMRGVLDDGLVLREITTRIVKDDSYSDDEKVEKEEERILVLSINGIQQHVELSPGGPFEGWRGGFRIIETHGRYLALLRNDRREMMALDVETNITYPVAKPTTGIWTPNGVPTIPTSSVDPTHSDEFVIGFRPTRGEWSLHKIRLSDRSVSQLGEYAGARPREIYPYKPRFAAESVANGQAVLAFTAAPNNSRLINIVDDYGNLLPVSILPADHFIFDAA